MPDRDPEKTAPTSIIGLRTKFIGTSGEHAYLKGHDVVIIGVIRGAQTIRAGVDYAYIADEDELVAAGGLDVAKDRLDVAPVIADPAAPGGVRLSFATSDVVPSDLVAWAPAAPVDTAAPAPPGTPAEEPTATEGPPGGPPSTSTWPPPRRS